MDEQERLLGEELDLRNFYPKMGMKTHSHFGLNALLAAPVKNGEEKAAAEPVFGPKQRDFMRQHAEEFLARLLDLREWREGSMEREMAGRIEAERLAGLREERGEFVRREYERRGAGRPR